MQSACEQVGVLVAAPFNRSRDAAAGAAGVSTAANRGFEHDDARDAATVVADPQHRGSNNG